jgi:hypothetical protein
MPRLNVEADANCSSRQYLHTPLVISKLHSADNTVLKVRALFDHGKGERRTRKGLLCDRVRFLSHMRSALLDMFEVDLQGFLKPCQI